MQDTAVIVLHDIPVLPQMLRAYGYYAASEEIQLSATSATTVKGEDSRPPLG
jgi:hypothetical protein